jgi:hypothetical protein
MLQKGIVLLMKYIFALLVAAAVGMPIMCFAEVPPFASEHYVLTWQAFISSLGIVAVLIGLMYRQTLERIKKVETVIGLTATKQDIEEIKVNCSTMQNNCPKNGTLSRIKEILKQNAIAIESINTLNKRILERQDDLRKELPESYIRRVEYEKRHESLERTINTGFDKVNTQLVDLVKAISIMQGMKAAFEVMVEGKKKNE